MRKIIFFVFLLAVVVGVQAQSECESMFNAAKSDYEKGKYKEALAQFKIIQKECDQNYGGTASYITNCNNILQEDADYQKCTTVEACNTYLSKYPKGRYANKVNVKRTELLNAWYMSQSQEKEDEEYEKCTTEEACRAYLEHYPNGRYVSQVEDRLNSFLQKKEDEDYKKCTTKEACSAYLSKYQNGRYETTVRDKLLEFEENEAYAKCTTESACDDYLKSYPNGRYWKEVMKKKEDLIKERFRKEMEAEKTAYMKIRKIEFANVDGNDNVINSYYGSIFYDSELKYLKPRITYDGILDETKSVYLNSKIIYPSGEVMSNANSAYTFSNHLQVKPGIYNKCELSGWGNSEGGYFKAGEYKFELWYNSERIYQTSFTIKAKENALSRGNWRDAIDKCKENVTRTLDNGIYKGQLVDGSRSGLGMYAWTDGTYYIGRWQSGSRNGMGMYISPSSGYHVRNCPDCVYYVGGWSNSTKSGTGTCYDKLGNLLYYGHFDDDKPTQNYPSNVGYENYRFECIKYSNGSYYVGETLKGKRHGKGIYFWSSGGMWYGDWIDGERDGYGIYMSYDGSVTVGTWKGDTKQ